ncbi:MAG TPA: hypothetical protein PK177_01025 [Burkholderiaceae bacterium]|nr:hypothetical protein [Burkholderiaceae bacterium]
MSVRDRGTLIGNRGVLHDDGGRIVRPWKSKAWIACALHWKDWQRAPFTPGTWSELFFLDEATAFSAGHRPCKLCRRARHIEFKGAWVRANRDLGEATAGEPPISRIDAILHDERAVRGGGKRTYRAAASELPDGTFIERGDRALMRWEGRFLEWSFSGYRETEMAVDDDAPVIVLTPASIVRMYRSGFRPGVHSTADTHGRDARLRRMILHGSERS